MMQKVREKCAKYVCNAEHVPQRLNRNACKRQMCTWYAKISKNYLYYIMIPRKINYFAMHVCTYEYEYH